MPPKRVRSPSPDKARKKRVNADVIVISDDEEDDLQDILALIKQNEESERLAQQLSGGSGSSSTAETEDDAAMARRLAAEWAEEGIEPLAGPSAPNDKDPLGDDPDRSPDEKLKEYRTFFTIQRPCTKCEKAVDSPRGFVVFSPTSVPGGISPSLGMLLHAPCSSCGTNHCRGCFTPLACSASCRGSGKNQKCSVESCCSGVRAIAVFECLGGFDRLFLGERASAASRSLELSKQAQPKSKSVGPGGTGYGADSRGGGYAYGGFGSRRGELSPSGSSKQKKAQLADHWDELLGRALQTLTKLLPSPYSDDAREYDLLPHASLGHLISLSQMPELLGTLLRNDSVTDWTTRSEVVEVLIARRFCLEKTSGLEEWMWDDAHVVLAWERDKDGLLERAPPLYDYFKKLTRQCEAFLAGARAMMDGGEDRDDTDTVHAISLCGDLLAAANDMERAMSVLGRVAAESAAASSSGKGKARDIEKEYAKACEALAFAHVEMDMRQYHYRDLLQQTQSATRAPNKRLHLLKELATMATSLPEGIFVRVDEVRNDAIKVMIAGPEGTPYAGGLFEFDCFMPLEYPSTPPLVHLRTTGGGTVRFNPNLYNEGKVCLSLLGTWPGRPEEQWSATKSTLLQVLVSIQSMILIDAPYFNEPGHGQSNPRSPASIKYNLEIERQTCRWAIVDWLQDANKDGLWKDVIASHFSIRKDRIRKQMLEWAKKNPGIRSYLGHRSRQTTDLVAGFDDAVKRWLQ